MVKEKIEIPNVYESALLEHERQLFEIDEEKFLRKAHQNPEHYKMVLMDLRNSLERYLDKDCRRNKQGEFLEKIEVFLATLYRKLPKELNDKVEDMVEHILDHYSENKEYYARKGEEQREQALRELLDKAGIEGVIDNKNGKEKK
ncbi:hypothetical protein MYX06_01320 [Patescibacteria group bacterium AH-259-L05]|nr:hypothetical protein [Patescibacteria group bacterium AH-259-L05]